MNKCIMTVCTADWYQNYIPLFIYSIQKTWEDVAVLIYVRGELNTIVDECLGHLNLHNVMIRENFAPDYPNNISTTNALRFVINPSIREDFEELFITDIDFFFVKTLDIFDYCRQNKIDDTYTGFAGPHAKPYRPEICESWTGEFARMAGGFFMAYPKWWEKAMYEIIYYSHQLKNNTIGTYREFDEVMLHRIAKKSGLSPPHSSPLPRFLRPVHFGDFRPNMRHRYTSRSKMRALLDMRIVKQFLRAKSEPTFGKIRNVLRESAEISTILDNTFNYCEKRISGEM